VSLRGRAFRNRSNPSLLGHFDQREKSIFFVIPNDFERARNHHNSVIPECIYRESSTPRVHEPDVAAPAATLQFRHPELDSGSRFFLVIPECLNRESNLCLCFLSRLGKGEQFRTSEELDALAYLLDVNPVQRISRIKVKQGGFISKSVIPNDFERVRNRTPLLSCANVYKVLLATCLYIGNACFK